MPRLTSTLQEEDFGTRQWLENDYRRFHASRRKELCGPTEILEIRVTKIVCEACHSAWECGVFAYSVPDVSEESWESDIAFIFDDETAVSLLEDEDAPRCQECRRNLHHASFYIETTDLEERFSVSAETNAINPSKKLRTAVSSLYDRQCFGCGSKEAIEIDHIEPRSAGGKASFGNLQPLCRECGNAKANRPSTIIVLESDGESLFL